MAGARGNMRHWVIVAALSLLAACSSKPADTARLTLNDFYWERVNVEIVITKNADCDNRGDGFISTRQLVMRKERAEAIDVPNGANVCWRHDRNPANPIAGVWSGWSRATLFPGQNAETDL